MELQELKDKLSAEKHIYDFTEEGGDLIIRNKKHGVKVRCSAEAVAKHDWASIKSQTVGGRDVNHITRVTGYFTIVEGWNKGKLGELKDRYHSQIA